MMKVMIFEDDTELRKEMVETVGRASNMNVVGDFGTSWDVLEKVKSWQPDVILMDIGMPSEEKQLDEEAGIKAILHLRDELEDECPAMIVISHFTDDDRIFKAFSAGGAIGYLAKPVGSEKLITAIEKAFRNELEVTSYVANRYYEVARNPLIAESAKALTERELEVLRYIKQGYSTPEITKLMGIVSINDLTKSIYYKLGVKCRVDAINKVWYNVMYVCRKLREAFKK